MHRRLPGYALASLMLVAGAGALAQAEAERRLDAAIERLRTTLGPDVRIEIGGRQVDPVTGRAVLSDVVLSQGGDRLAIPELRLADVSETRVGRAELLRGTYQGAGGGTGEVARVLVAGLPVPVAGKSLDLTNLAFDTLEVEAARLDDAAKGTLRLGRLEVRDWRPSGIGAAALEGFEFRGVPADSQSARLGRVNLEAVSLPLVNGAFAPLAFRAGRIAVEGAELHAAEQGVTVALGRLALQDWLPGQPTSLTLEGVQVASPAGTQGTIALSLARFDAAGIDAARTLDAVMSNRQVPDPFPGTPQRAQLDGLESAWNGQPVFALARLLAEGALEGGIATGRLAAEGMRIIPPRGQADWLESLGYREIAGAIETRASAPRAGGRMEIAPFQIGWQDAATLNLTAALDGMPAAPPAGSVVDTDMTAAQLMAARVETLTLALRDQGLLGRFIASQARQQRVPEARLREQWAQMALAMPLPGAPTSQQPGRRGQAQPQAKGAAQAADPLAPMRQAIAAFIRQPGTLEIGVRPPKPVAFNEMLGLGGGNPVETVQRLGLTVVAR